MLTQHIEICFFEFWPYRYHRADTSVYVLTTFNMSGSYRVSREGSNSQPGNLLSLPTALTARRHLETKKSDSRKVHPGYSMFEWNVLCKSGQDLTGGVSGKLRKVTPDELARHSSEGDVWTAVRGKVYNITDFLKFHPGGKAQIMRGAGNDCTELYDKIHIWVNSENILEKCFVGYLDVTKSRLGLNPKPQTQTLGVNSPSSLSIKPSTKPDDNVDSELSFPVPVITSPPSKTNTDNSLSLQLLRQAKISGVESITMSDDELSIHVPTDWVTEAPPPQSVGAVIDYDDELGTSVDPPTNNGRQFVVYETAV